MGRERKGKEGGRRERKRNVSMCESLGLSFFKSDHTSSGLVPSFTPVYLFYYVTIIGNKNTQTVGKNE